MICGLKKLLPNIGSRSNALKKVRGIMRSTIFKKTPISSAWLFGFPLTVLFSVLIHACSNQSAPPTAESNAGEASTEVATKEAGSRVIEGETRPLGGGNVTSYIKLDANGKPESLGLKFDKAALANLPQQCKTDKIPSTSFWEFCFGGKMNDALITIFDTPPEAAMTNVKTLELSWLPHGHAPEKVWDIPQFNIHFNFDSPTGGKDMSKLYVDPPKGELPEGYVILPKSGFPWDTPAQQGHSHSADPQISPEFKGGRLATNFLYITYDGKVIGYEPYVAYDYLKEKTNLKEYPIKQPEKYPKDGYYPSTMKVGLDENGNYIIAIEGFKEYKAAASK